MRLSKRSRAGCALARRVLPMCFPRGGAWTASATAPPGAADGFVLDAAAGVVVSYAGAAAHEGERSFTSTAVLSREASHAAIVHERRARGHVVLFGIEPAFRGQWPNTARLLYNALLLPAGS